MPSAAPQIAREKLVSLGTCVGKLTHTGKFRLTIGALDLLAQYAKYKVGQGAPEGGPMPGKGWLWRGGRLPAGGAAWFMHACACSRCARACELQTPPAARLRVCAGSVRSVACAETRTSAPPPPTTTTTHTLAHATRTHVSLACTRAHCGARAQIWLKPSAEMQFLYGNNVLKSGLARITENTPTYTGVVIYNMADIPLGFGVTAKSTNECRALDPSAIVAFHQADAGGCDGFLCVGGGGSGWGAAARGRPLCCGWGGRSLGPHTQPASAVCSWWSCNPTNCVKECRVRRCTGLQEGCGRNASRRPEERAGLDCMEIAHLPTYVRQRERAMRNAACCQLTFPARVDLCGLCCLCRRVLES